jgi:hypothetical protein
MSSRMCVPQQLRSSPCVASPALAHYFSLFRMTYPKNSQFVLAPLLAQCAPITPANRNYTMDVREPDLTHKKIDPSSCTVMEGHQHDPTDIEALADNIVALGQLHPSLIIQYPDGRRLIAAGRRRWMACKARGLQLIANIWLCEEEDTNIELFAKAIRVAENLERRDPSAMDIAVQLRTIRSERGFRNARELGASIGMGESLTKKYLSVFKASDYLQEQARLHSIALAPLMELTKLEKQVDARAIRAHVAKHVKGELSTTDLSKLRGRSTAKPRAPKAPKNPMATLLAASDCVLTACMSDDPAVLTHVSALFGRMQEQLEEEAQEVLQVG